MSGLLRFLRTAMFGGAVFLVAMMGCSGTGTDIENDDDEPEDTTPPATVTDLRVVNPTPTTLTLRWTAPGDDGNEGFAVAYDLRMSGQPILPDNFTQAATHRPGGRSPAPRHHRGSGGPEFDRGRDLPLRRPGPG